MKRIQNLFFLIPGVLLILAFSADAQTVNIPDANLRAAIAETLGKPGNAALTRSDMARLKRLEKHETNISNLTGLEFATNLGEIRINHGLISDLSPLSGLQHLHVIELRDHVINDLSPLSGLSNVGWLIVNGNLISDLTPIAGLTGMIALEVSHNVITDLSPIANFQRLTHIWMSENPAADLSPLSGLKRLMLFRSWGTPILDLTPLTQLPKLRVLDICGGALTDISALSSMTHLRELYLAGNEIRDVSPLSSLTSLSHLNLRRNEIKDVSPLSSLTSLRYLNLKHNEIKDVSPLSSLTHLSHLYLDDNSISDFSGLEVLSDQTLISKRENPGSPRGRNVFNYHGDPPRGRKITGPWLWVIVPGSWLGSKDWLSEASGGVVRERSVASIGAKEGTPVGNSKWRAHTLPATSHDNINEMTEALGWGKRWQIYDHIVYGSISLESPRDQETTMLVGSDDAVKVWLNGKLVHQALVDRAAEDYQDAFPVKLKRGTNVLLVAIDNNGHGDFAGFFGFEADTAYTVNPTDALLRLSFTREDVNRDGVVSILDLILVAQDFGKAVSRNPRTDVNADGLRNVLDLNLVAKQIDAETGAAPLASVLDASISPARVRAWISMAERFNDNSLAFSEGIANLKRLLATLLPSQTAVLANYPNPFNPETWIPYQLAEPADVRMRIYDMRGVVVRELKLGHQPAGEYREKSRAAYWDGRNQVGEPVASGLYFYTLTAGEFTGTGKMLIRK